MKHAADLAEIFSGRLEKKVIEEKLCEKCGRNYQVFEMYFDGEFKSRSEVCNPCRQAEEDKKIVEKVLRENEKRRFIKYHKLSVTPFELEDEDFFTYQPKNESQERALDVVQQFANNQMDKTTLFFQGDTGLGKTHLSYSVYKKYREVNKKSAIFIDLPSLLSTIRGTYSDREGMTQEGIMKMINDCELLVLDDIGAEYVKPDANGFESWAADILFQIVNSRQGKKTIYTTNFSSKHLSQKYGMMSKRIISRMMNNAKVIKFEGEDHRLKGLD